MRWRACIGLLALLYLLACQAGCSQPRVAVERLAKARLLPSDPVPPPDGKTVLTVGGLVGALPEAHEIDVIGLVGCTVADPWQRQPVTYGGVLLSDLVAIAGAWPEATHLITFGLDGSAGALSLDTLTQWPVLLTTRSGNDCVTVQHGGPMRILLPYDAYPDPADARYLSVRHVTRMDLGRSQ